MNAAFDAYVAPARNYPQLWRLIAGLAVAVGVYVGWLGIVFGSAWGVAGMEWIQTKFGGGAMGANPISTILLLFTFLGMALGAWAAARAMHMRNIWTLLGPVRILIGDFIIAAVVVIVIFGAFELVYPPDFEPVANLSFDIWIAVLPFTLIGILIQTGAEEILFRGYVQQQLAALNKSPLVWMILPSLTFGLLHYDEAAGQTAWLIIAATTLFALLAADLVRVTGSLGAAWGFHFANNLFALTYIALDETITGVALYTTPFGPGAFDILSVLILRDMAIVLAAWLPLRFLVSRRLQ